jgi:hypothetical protein
MKTSVKDAWISARAAAALAGVSPRTMRCVIASGAVKTLSLPGTRRRVSKAAVLELVERSTKPAGV